MEGGEALPLCETSMRTVVGIQYKKIQSIKKKQTIKCDNNACMKDIQLSEGNKNPPISIRISLRGHSYRLIHVLSLFYYYEYTLDEWTQLHFNFV